MYFGFWFCYITEWLMQLRPLAWKLHYQYFTWLQFAEYCLYAFLSSNNISAIELFLRFFVRTKSGNSTFSVVTIGLRSELAADFLKLLYSVFLVDHLLNSKLGLRLHTIKYHIIDGAGIYFLWNYILMFHGYACTQKRAWNVSVFTIVSRYNPETVK